MVETGEVSEKEARIRKITQLYYSRPDIQKAIWEFCKHREVSPRYFEGFGKRPDMLEYAGDVFELVKKGATSFHCSEERWTDPMRIETGMSEEQYNSLRSGWDFLIDIDSKYLDYSQTLAKVLVKFLKAHGVKNIGIKFSGSKGFHMIIPWEAFPEKLDGVETKNMFPLWPRILARYLTEKTKDSLIRELMKFDKQSQYIHDPLVAKEVMPDIILVAPRHLFRTPYSLHEKTARCSMVLTPEELEIFTPNMADPLTAPIRSFMPKVQPDEARSLLIAALEWGQEEEKKQPKKIEVIAKEFKKVDVPPEMITEEYFPPAVLTILEGLADGKKRGLFVLINFFRSLGMSQEALFEKLLLWNKKNKVQLHEGYIRTQIEWSLRHKVMLPPNYDRDYYEGVGAIPTAEEKRFKNPVNYTLAKIRKVLEDKTKDNFKKKQ